MHIAHPCGLPICCSKLTVSKKNPLCEPGGGDNYRPCRSPRNCAVIIVVTRFYTARHPFQHMLLYTTHSGRRPIAVYASTTKKNVQRTTTVTLLQRKLAKQARRTTTVTLLLAMTHAYHCSNASSSTQRSGRPCLLTAFTPPQTPRLLRNRGTHLTTPQPPMNQC